ncbi:hypothetical protein [Azospirillum rugosum]|uniref:Uncharacterized protein n=1 Tax=Azospirillum rugosum TaxID=416170 RepID=A0ABS4SY52_9PROT|nr:hypothetical protein [Azospirillum rugosum]MBP2296320.1 hypothetical protein [Azospirillum rugosum]MDQ0529841.1 hypothetical protein [Azospirillum rugosum]
MTNVKNNNEQPTSTTETTVIFANAGAAAYATIIPAKPDKAGDTNTDKPAEA